MSYKHLSQTERYQIYALMKAGHLPVEIAKLLGRHKSSISSEFSRNTGKRSYRPQQADQRYQERAQSSRNARRIGEATRALVAEPLILQWSPEQIILQNRQVVYEAAKLARPDRWRNRSTRNWDRPQQVWLNPPKEHYSGQADLKRAA